MLIPEQLQAKVRSFGEVSMGATRVALVLSSGEVIDDVIVAWGREIVRVGGAEPSNIPIEQVIDVIDRSDAP